MKYKKLIVKSTALILLVSSVGCLGSAFFAPVKGQASTVISLNFEGIDEGLNPHGSSFEIQELKEFDLLQKTITELELGSKVTPDKLAKHIVLNPYVPSDVLDRILPSAQGSGVSQVQDLDGQTYHPTQYAVSIERTSELDLNKKELAAVLEKLILNYTEAFKDKYKDTGALAIAIPTIEPTRYDYSEYLLLAEGQLEIMNEYLLAKEQEADDFKSQTTGLRFSDLIAQVEVLRDIEISNLKGLIDTFVITNDKEELTAVYENRLKTLGREKSILLKQKDSIANAIATYEKDPTVILDNGTVVSGEGNGSDSLYDELVRESLSVETQLKQTTYQIVTYTELLVKVQAEGASAAPKAYVEEVGESVESISTRITELADLTTKTADEYYETDAFAESITLTKGIDYTGAFRLGFVKNILMIGLITSIGFVLALIGALGKELNDERREKQKLS